MPVGLSRWWASVRSGKKASWAPVRGECIAVACNGTWLRCRPQAEGDGPLSIPFSISEASPSEVSAGGDGEPLAKTGIKAWAHRWRMRNSRPFWVALLPPLVQIESRPLPRIPLVDLLAASADGLLWQQLFPERDGSSQLLGWKRCPGRTQSDDDQIIAAFGKLPGAHGICSALGLRQPQQLRFVIPLPDQENDLWRLNPRRNAALVPAAPPLLFNPSPVSRLTLLGLASALLLAAALSLMLLAQAWTPVDLVATTNLSNQLIEQRAANRELQRQLDISIDARRRRGLEHQQVVLQNRWLEGLATAMPPGLRLQRIILEEGGLSISAHASEAHGFSQLVSSWLPPHSEGLKLQSVRKVGADKYVFSAILKPLQRAAM